MSKTLKVMLLTISILIAGMFIWNIGYDYYDNIPRPGTFIKAGKMIIPRYGHEAVLLDDGKVLIVGGRTEARNLIAPPSLYAEIYDPKTKKFTHAGNVIQKRYAFTATKLNNEKVLITGGQGKFNRVLKNTELYNPKTEKFEKGSDMNFRRDDHTATLLNDGRVLIVGGFGGILKSEIYNPKTNKFTLIAGLNIPRRRHSAVLLKDGRVLILGGVGKNKILSSAEIYDPKTNKFESAGDMNIARRNPDVFLLKNGKVIISGGIDNTKTPYIWVKEIEMFDPKTKEFTIMTKKHSNLQTSKTVLLKDDRILFTGGSTGVGISLQYHKKSEIYNPETNTFTKTKDMKLVRAGHKATLLKDGNVLITGSYGPKNSKIAELYINE